MIVIQCHYVISERSSQDVDMEAVVWHGRYDCTQDIHVWPVRAWTAVRHIFIEVKRRSHCITRQVSVQVGLLQEGQHLP
jgi:hypothetical protein